MSLKVRNNNCFNGVFAGVYILGIVQLVYIIIKLYEDNIIRKLIWTEYKLKTILCTYR